MWECRGGVRRHNRALSGRVRGTLHGRQDPAVGVKGTMLRAFPSLGSSASSKAALPHGRCHTPAFAVCKVSCVTNVRTGTHDPASDTAHLTREAIGTALRQCWDRTALQVAKAIMLVSVAAPSNGPRTGPTRVDSSKMPIARPRSLPGYMSAMVPMPAPLQDKATQAVGTQSNHT